MPLAVVIFLYFFFWTSSYSLHNQLMNLEIFCRYTVLYLYSSITHGNRSLKKKKKNIGLLCEATVVFTTLIMYVYHLIRYFKNLANSL